MSAHHTPEEIRKDLTHPVIDGDGHWVEYTPVFAEKIRKVTGDLGANGFLQSQLRAKVCMLGSGVRRPIPHAKGAPADLARYAQGFDQLGLDSDYDYDPLWQKCRELGTAPTFHTGGRSYGERHSPTNFTFNHIGHFAAAGHNVA